VKKLLKKAFFCLLAIIAGGALFYFYGSDGDKNSGGWVVSRPSVPGAQLEIAPSPPKGYGTIVIKGSF
jgi:hypothetical protein